MIIADIHVNFKLIVKEFENILQTKIKIILSFARFGVRWGAKRTKEYLSVAFIKNMGADT